MDASVGEEAIVQEATQRSERSRRRWITVNLALVNLVVSINYAILAPFFPAEAQAKGVSTAMIGFIFGEFELIIFLTAPVFGILLPRIGAKFLYIAGMFLSGACAILFGALAYCPPGALFIGMSLCVRGVMAVGASMLFTASFAIIAASFPDAITTMFGLLETFSGIGLMAGPPVGGALYQAGGFLLPFAVMGGLLLAVVPVTCCILHFDSDSLPATTGSLRALLTNPHILFAAVVLWGAAVTIGFEDPILQPFLTDKFHLSEFLIGVVFLCGPATYALLSPLVGHFCDRTAVTKEIMACSLFLLGVSMLLVNPSPVLNVGPPRLWLTIVAGFVFGVGVGVALCPATKDVLDECLYMGYQDNFGTFSLVSGFINGCLSLGFFSGPIISGALTDKFGFAWSTTGMGFFLIGLGFVYLIYCVIFMYCCDGRRRRLPETGTPAEQEPLLVAT